MITTWFYENRMKNKLFYFLIVIVLIILIFARCMETQSSPDPRGTAYTGSNKCLQCHQNVSLSFFHNTHALSTRIADSNSVIGSFSQDSNNLVIDDTTKIVMEKRDSGLYQVLYVNDKIKKERRFDLVMGSNKVQSFFYWQDDGFFQLPVFYFLNNRTWSSSPGTYSSKINFSRPAVMGCFECHTSFASGDPHGITVAVAKKNNWVFNIDCERCHGPGNDHVKYHESHPDDRTSQGMVSFNLLSRQRKVDACAVCHSGTQYVSLRSPFRFKFGDTLTSFIKILPSNPAVIDLHENITQLLSSSKCYRNATLDCTTCHSIHSNTEFNLNVVNDKCQGCHINGKNYCKLANDSTVAFLKSNCTTCHMPRQSGPSLLVETAGNQSPTAMQIVNHHIGKYPEVSIKMMNNFKSLQQNSPGR